MRLFFFSQKIVFLFYKNMDKEQETPLERRKK